MRLDETYSKDKIHDAWESIYRGNHLLDKRNDQIMDRIMNYLQPAVDAKFLDAGCGIGDHTARIVRRGYECLGVDISMTILERAEKRMQSLGLGERARFKRVPLEDLSLDDETFDVIHCRGVLMHIPDWKKALGCLCAVLRPGGHIVIFENNVKALYSRMYLFARGLFKGRVASSRTDTEGGTELWTLEDGTPFVVRMANINALNAALREFGVDPVYRFTTSLIGIEEFPAGWIRNAAIRLNIGSFRLSVPPALCKGNVIIAKKRAARDAR